MAERSSRRPAGDRGPASPEGTGLHDHGQEEREGGPDPGDPAAVCRPLETSRRSDSVLASAHVSLAVMATEDGRSDEALAHWRSAVESDPSQHAKLLAIGGRLWSAGRRSEARPLLELFATSAPPAAYGEEIGRVRGLLAGSP